MCARRANKLMPTDLPLHHTKQLALIVDDDKSLRRMVCMVLEDGEWDVLEAKDGIEALAILRSSPRHLVVLLDWMMPEMSGEDVLDVVNADRDLATRHAYVLITANAAVLTPHMRDLLRELSVPLLTKPFGIQDLLHIVEDQARRIHVEEGS
jgi:CheY-like chemotaxis protein